MIVTRGISTDFLGSQSFLAISRLLLTSLFPSPAGLSVSGGCSCLGRGFKAHGYFGLGRLFLRLEGVFARGGRRCRAYFLVTGYCPSFSPSRDKIALRLFVSAPFSSLLFLAWEGLSVSGGCFYAWRVVLAHILPVYVSTPDIFTLQGLRTYRKISPSR